MGRVGDPSRVPRGCQPPVRRFAHTLAPPAHEPRGNNRTGARLRRCRDRPPGPEATENPSEPPAETSPGRPRARPFRLPPQEARLGERPRTRTSGSHGEAEPPLDPWERFVIEYHAPRDSGRKRPAWTVEDKGEADAGVHEAVRGRGEGLPAAFDRRGGDGGADGNGRRQDGCGVVVWTLPGPAGRHRSARATSAHRGSWKDSPVRSMIVRETRGVDAGRLSPWIRFRKPK